MENSEEPKGHSEIIFPKAKEGLPNCAKQEFIHQLLVG
jgi:hypothetical protein